MPLPPSLPPDRTGLVVIDLQNGFCHPRGSRAQAFGAEAVSAPAAIVPGVLALVAAFRERGLPVWFTRQVHFPGDRMRAARVIPSHLERRGLRLDLCHRGTWDAELLDEVGAAVQAPDEVVVKHRASAFFQTTFESELRMSGVQVLTVTGTTTSFCVDSTIRDAYARDFDVVVPAELVADTDQAAHDAVLASTDRFHGVVTGADELLTALDAGGGRSAA